MSLRPHYLVFTLPLDWLALLRRSSASKDIELLVLRHEVTMLRRTHPKPRFNWADRAYLAALIRQLSRQLRRHRHHARHDAVQPLRCCTAMHPRPTCGRWRLPR